MRGFLIFLALAFPVVLASPTFWSLVAMEYSAMPITYGHADGTKQNALLGPKAPWPDWAIKPDATELTVRAWFDDVPGRPGSGHGNLTYRGRPEVIAKEYAERLRGAGWTVHVYKYQAGVPNPIAPYIIACVVQASRDNDLRTLQASFEFEPQNGTGTMHWSMAPRPTLADPRTPC
jgi:hypothetical protein